MKKHLYIVTAFLILVPILLLLIRPLFSQSMRNSLPKITPTPKSIPVVAVQDVVLEIKNGNIISGPQTISVHQGDTIHLKVTADIDEVLSIKQVEKTLTLKKDTVSTMTFKADTTGSFPYELTQSKKQLGTLDVFPR